MNEGTKRAALHNQELGAYWHHVAMTHIDLQRSFWQEDILRKDYAIACQEHARRSYAIARAILTDDPEFPHLYD